MKLDNIKLWSFSIIAVVSGYIGSVFMMVIGAIKVGKAIKSYVFGSQTAVDELHRTSTDLAMVGLVESVDAFLFGLVLIVFSTGVNNLFVKSEPVQNNNLPKWARVNSLGELKGALGQVIIVILFVLFLRILLLHSSNLTWNILVLPIGILCLAISLRLLDLHKHSHEKEQDAP